CTWRAAETAVVLRCEFAVAHHGGPPGRLAHHFEEPREFFGARLMLVPRGDLLRLPGVSFHGVLQAIARRALLRGGQHDRIRGRCSRRMHFSLARPESPTVSVENT